MSSQLRKSSHSTNNSCKYFKTLISFRTLNNEFTAKKAEVQKDLKEGTKDKDAIKAELIEFYE